MDFQSTATSPLSWTGDGLALGLLETDIQEGGSLVEAYQELDQLLEGALQEAIAEAEFKGKKGSTVALRVGGKGVIKKLILVGLGEAESLSLEHLRQGGAAIAKAAKTQKCKSLGIRVPSVRGDASATAQALTEGFELALYKDIRFKSKDEDKTPEPLAQVTLLELGDQSAAIARAQQIVSGVVLARQMVAAPPNDMDPIAMAQIAQDLAKDYGLKLEILEKEACEARGMGAFLGVAQASDLPPKFIHLTYTPKTGTARKKLAIVGKGLTFDSGGLNLKGAGSGIETMKMDMGGAAATLGAAKAIAQLQPDVEVHFISAVTENMISGRAMRPGDILTASNGKTIEINNTDAEGRLTLADALVYADQLGVDAIVDLATLTGACIVALGNNIAGLWSTDEALAEALKAAADSTGEKIWQMPMEENYFDGIKSPIADLKNTGPRAGGSITAALFLKEFVKDTAAWAHIDLAGPAWLDKESGYNPAGATGYGVRMLVNWVLA